jgi:hypothetical protein
MVIKSAVRARTMVSKGNKSRPIDLHVSLRSSLPINALPPIDERLAARPRCDKKLVGRYEIVDAEWTCDKLVTFGSLYLNPANLLIPIHVTHNTTPVKKLIMTIQHKRDFYCLE